MQKYITPEKSAKQPEDLLVSNQDWATLQSLLQNVDYNSLNAYFNSPLWNTETVPSQNGISPLSEYLTYEQKQRDEYNTNILQNYQQKFQTNTQTDESTYPNTDQNSYYQPLENLAMRWWNIQANIEKVLLYTVEIKVILML